MALYYLHNNHTTSYCNIVLATIVTYPIQILSYPVHLNKLLKPSGQIA